MKKITKTTKIIILAVIAVIVMQIGPVDASNEVSLSVDQFVRQSADNDVQKKINDLEKNLKNLRAAYTPSPGTGLAAGSWAVTYAMSIAPLLQDASTNATNYQDITNKNYLDEYGYYNQAYTLWLAMQNLQYQLANMNLAGNEKDLTQKKLDQGTASQNDLLQAEISYNQAKADYLKADTNKQLATYQTNETSGYLLNEPLNVSDVNVVFLTDDELNVDQTLNYVLQNHQSLVSLNKLLNAYQKGYDMASQQTDVNVPVDGLKDYFNKETQEANLKLQQAHQGLELATRSYSDQLKSLETRIKLDQEAVEKMNQVYSNSTKLYEVGMSTFNDLEAIRVKLLGLQLQQAQDEKDYLLLKEKLRLFKDGATFVS